MTAENNERIAKNTIMLYIRMLCIMGVSLYTSRVVLQLLGVVDYGIYNVVGGIVAMFSFLSNSMANATQRFLSYELGKKSGGELQLVFSTSLNIHFIIGVVVLLLAEIIGVLFISHKVNIPPSRLHAAIWVFHCSILSFFVTILQTPYNALIVAYERMNIYALVSIIEATLKLSVVFMLYLIDFDKLTLYATLMLIVTSLVAFIYWMYCSRKYKMCQYRFYWDKMQFQYMFSFAKWNLFGSIAWLLKGQGVNILLNLFFGTIVNAARGIAYQVSGSITTFMVNFQTAVNPQIIKYYANDQIGNMLNLVFRSAKYSFYLILFLTIPVFLETSYILHVWLTVVPDYTVLFCRLILLDVLLDSVSGPMMTAVQATGKIKVYQILVGSILLLNIPVSYLFFKSGFPPETAMCVSIILTLFAIVARLWILKKVLGCSMRLFFSSLFLCIGKVLILAPLLPILLYLVVEPGILRLFLVTFGSTISVCTIVYKLGMENQERIFVKNRIREVLIKIKKHK